MNTNPFFENYPLEMQKEMKERCDRIGPVELPIERIKRLTKELIDQQEELKKKEQWMQKELSK